MCDEHCVCPMHDTPMLYSAATDDHACPDPDCVLAHGVNDVLADAISRWRHVR